MLMGLLTKKPKFQRQPMISNFYHLIYLWCGGVPEIEKIGPETDPRELGVTRTGSVGEKNMYKSTNHTKYSWRWRWSLKQIKEAPVRPVEETRWCSDGGRPVCEMHACDRTWVEVWTWTTWAVVDGAPTLKSPEELGSSIAGDGGFQQYNSCFRR